MPFIIAKPSITLAALASASFDSYMGIRNTLVQVRTVPFVLGTSVGTFVAAFVAAFMAAFASFRGAFVAWG